MVELIERVPPARNRLSAYSCYAVIWQYGARGSFGAQTVRFNRALYPKISGRV